MSSSYRSPEYTHCLRDARFRYNVYEPEADTFLFLEALDKDAVLLRDMNPQRCVEVGCGSGTVITHLRCLLMPALSAAPQIHDDTTLGEEGTESAPAFFSAARGGPHFAVVDVNPLALEATGITWTDTLVKHFSASDLTPHFSRVFHCAVPASLALPIVNASFASSQENGASATQPPLLSSATHSPPSHPTTVRGGDADVSSSTYCLHRFHGDLFEPFGPPHAAPSTSGFDVVLFNPPYVPTSLEELEAAVSKRDVITAAWCGGPRGRIVLDRFLQQLPSVLSPTGVCYVVLIKENDVADVAGFVQQAFRAHLSHVGRLGENGEAEDVVEMVEVTARYTGEHLSVHRIRYRHPYSRKE